MGASSISTHRYRRPHSPILIFTTLLLKMSFHSQYRMYSLSLFLASSLLSLSTVHSNALPSPVFGSLDLQTRVTDDISPQELTTPSLNGGPECSFNLGRDLNYRSCEHVLTNIPRDLTPMTFGDRNTGNWDVILPHRYLSCGSMKGFRDGVGEGDFAKVLVQTTANVRLTSKRTLMGPGEIYSITFSCGMLPEQFSVLVSMCDPPTAAAL